MPHKLSIISKLSLVLILLSSLTSGCKKFNSGEDRDYGYAKVIVTCNKCAVSYTSGGELNEFVVEENSGINYIRYKRNFNLDINIKALTTDQNLNLSIYSRSGKQVLLKTVSQKANETWNSVVLIP